MARTKNQGNGQLEEALQKLILAQASRVQNQALFEAQIAETNRRMDETNRRIDERFARVEAILLRHSQILDEHTRILQALPEAVREKMGFRASPPQ